MQLHAFGEGAEHFLGDLLGYWCREWRAYIGPKLAKLQAIRRTSLSDPEIIGELTCVGEFERRHKTTDKPITAGDAVLLSRTQRREIPARRWKRIFSPPTATDGYYCGIDRLDRDAGELDLVWTEKLRESGTCPAARWPPRLGRGQAETPGAAGIRRRSSTAPRPTRSTMSLLRRDLPRFIGDGPAGGLFTDDLDDMTALGRPDWTTATWRSRAHPEPVRPTPPRTWCTPSSWPASGSASPQ